LEFCGKVGATWLEVVAHHQVNGGVASESAEFVNVHTGGNGERDEGRAERVKVVAAEAISFSPVSNQVTL